LGYRIDDLEPSPPAAALTGPTSEPFTAPLGDDHVGSLSSGDPAGVNIPSPPTTSSSDVNAGSLPSRPYRRLRF
jgi:hypothetical protein